MFCTECFCSKCPYGLKCYICERELDGHLIIVEGCHGDREIDCCILEHIAPKHASMLREMIKNKDTKAIEAFFDHKTGLWYTEEGWKANENNQ